MATLLLKNALVVATMDDERRELPDCDVLVDGPAIVRVEPGIDEPADEVIDCRGCVVLPGFVNTHNHLFQTLYRVMPQTQATDFVTWIGFLSQLWLRNPPVPDAVHAAALANFGEMLVTGTTTSADQHYLHIPGVPKLMVDRSVDAAREIGIRFHPARGCCTLGRSNGGLVADEICETEDEVLEHAADLIARYHDPSPYAMTRMVLGPLGPYADTETIYREMALLADEHPGVTLHTHLHEIADMAFCLERYGLRPLELMERAGWVGDRVLFYHMSDPAPTREDVDKVAAMGCHVSHCLGSDMALSYDVMPIRDLVDAGANLCLGTTGCASNLGGHVLIEARFVAAVHRLSSKDPRRWVTPREVLWMATRGGAAGLNRDDIGSLEPGKAADIAVFDTNRLDFVGAHDPLAALVMLGATHHTKATVVNGRVVARDGHLVSMDEQTIVQQASDWARRLTA